MSGFNFGGGNVHMIVEEAPLAEPRQRGVLERPEHLLVLSARDGNALRELAERYAAVLAPGCDLSAADICYTAGAGRSHFARRLTVRACAPKGLRKGLRDFLDDAENIRVNHAVVPRGYAPRTAFIFHDSAAGFRTLGRQLYHTQPEFRRMIKRFDTVLCAAPDQRPVADELADLAGAEDAAISGSRAGLVHVMLSCALAEMLTGWGIRPDAVLGLGAGEISAACVAGALDIERGLILCRQETPLPENAVPLHLAPLRIPLVSGSSGVILDAGAIPDAFSRGQGPEAILPASDLIKLLATDCRCGILLEIGAGRLAREFRDRCAPAWLHGIEGGNAPWRTILDAVSGAYVRGVDVDWECFDTGYDRRKVVLPTYPFQRRFCWPPQDRIGGPPRAAKGRAGR